MNFYKWLRRQPHWVGLAIAFVVACTDGADKKQTSMDAPATVVRNADSSEVMFIQFTNLIRGYQVSVVWHPIMEHDGAYGPAEITFENPKDHSRHIFTTNRFWMSKKLLPAELFTHKKITIADSSEFTPKIEFNDSTFSIAAKGVRINVAYPTSHPNDAPFYFEDVSFDGKDELIIVERGMGQRGENSYTAYNFACEIDEMYDGTRPVDYHDRIHELYGSFDVNTEFDHKNKTMKTSAASSAGSGAEATFGFVQMLPDSLDYLLPRESAHGGKMFVPIRIEEWDLQFDNATHVYTIAPPVITRKREKN